MSATHWLSEAAFDSLAAGRGDAPVVKGLRAGQLSRRKLQLRLLLDSEPKLAEPFALLVEATTRAPEVEGRLLAHPHFGAWLAAASRLIQESDAGRVSLGYLGGLATTAGFLAGMDFSLNVQACNGTVMLPLLGRASTAESSVTVSYDGGRIRVGQVTVPEQPEQDAPGWHGLRTLTSSAGGLEIRISLDDLDPFRGNAVHPAARRLSDEGVAVWQRMLAEAWSTLVLHHRHYAEGIAEGLSVIVPLHTERSTLGANVTNKDSFGAISMTTPASGEALAVGLVHEFQHAKLYAIGDIIKLHEYDTQNQFYAPWRDDPRPLGAALQGVYAFLGVTDFWRVERHFLSSALARNADAEFARWRDRIRLTTRALMASSQFTTAGRRFLDGLWARQQLWHTEPVSSEAAELADEASEDHWVGWRLRNRLPDQAVVQNLAQRWLQGLSCPDNIVPVATVASQRAALSSSVRLDLSRLRITDPSRFAALRAAPQRLANELPGATAGDLALAWGDYEAATASYREQIVAGAGGLGPWIGLTLASRRGRTPIAALADSPELCLAMHTGLSAPGQQAPDPISIAQWLSATSVAVPGHS